LGDRDVKNVGPVSRQWLHEIGVFDLNDLRRVGAVSAFRMIKSIRPRCSLNLLWALEGAVRDENWVTLSESVKEKLKADLARSGNSDSR
jgi:DNA transformation protein